MRIPRWIVIGLAILGSIGFAWLLTIPSVLFGVDLGPGLTVVASSALLAVTWAYVGHTKASLDTQQDLLNAEIKQHRANQKIAHYTAVSQLWAVALAAEDAITDIEAALRKARSAGTDREIWVDASKSAADASRALRAQTGRLMELFVDVDDPIEQLTLKIVNNCLDVCADVMRFATLILIEARDSQSAARDFSVENIIKEWEAPADGDRSAVRFVDLLSGTSVGELDDEFTRYRVACREEVRARSAA